MTPQGRRGPGSSTRAIAGLGDLDWDAIRPLLFRRRDRQLLRVVSARNVTALRRLARGRGRRARVAALLAGAFLLESGEVADALDLVRRCLRGPDPGRSHFVRHVLAKPDAAFQFSGPGGVPLSHSWDRELALILCSRLSLVLGDPVSACHYAVSLSAGDINDAIKAEAFLAAHRWDDLDRVLNAPSRTTTSDIGGYLTLARGIALRERGHASEGAEVIRGIVEGGRLAQPLQIEAHIELCVCWVYAGNREAAEQEYSIIERARTDDLRMRRLRDALDALDLSG